MRLKPVYSLRFTVYSLLAVVFLFAICHTSYALCADAGGSAKLEKVDVVEYEGGASLYIKTGAPADYIAYAADDGKKIIVDFLAPVADGLDKEIEVNKADIVRIKKFLKGAEVDFLSVELVKPQQYKDAVAGDSVVVDIGAQKPEAKEAEAAEAVEAAGEERVEIEEFEAPEVKPAEPEAAVEEKGAEVSEAKETGLFHGEPRELPVGPLKKIWEWTPRTERTEVAWMRERPGFQSFYREGAGFKVLPFLGVAAGTEIVEEPNPVDDCILEAKQCAWTTKAQRKKIARELFTRAYTARAIFDYKQFPRLRYTWDDRLQLHEYEAEWGIKRQAPVTHSVDLLYSFPPILGKTIVTVNPWYKRIKLNSKDDPNSVEERDEYIMNLSLADIGPLDLVFGSIDFYEGKKTRTTWVSKPNQWVFKLELRDSFPNQRILLVPGWYYTRTRYRPSPDRSTKHEIFLEAGKDFTDRIRLTTKPKVILAKNEWPAQPEQGDTGSALTPGLTEADANVLEWSNVLSYELFKDFDIRLLLEHNNGFSYKAFNNVGIGPEIELFKPGRVRLKLGLKYNNYYCLDKGLWTAYTKMHFAM